MSYLIIKLISGHACVSCERILSGLFLFSKSAPVAEWSCAGSPFRWETMLLSADNNRSLRRWFELRVVTNNIAAVWISVVVAGCAKRLLCRSEVILSISNWIICRLPLSRWASSSDYFCIHRFNATYLLDVCRS